MRLRSLGDMVAGRHLNCTILEKSASAPVAFNQKQETVAWWVIVVILAWVLTWWAFLVGRLFLTAGFAAVCAPLIDAVKLCGRMVRPAQLDPVVSNLFQKRRLQRMHKGINVVTYWMAPTVSMIWLFSVNDIVTATSSGDRSYWIYNRIFESATFPGMLCALITMFFTTFPRFLTLRSGDVSSMIIFLMLGFQAAFVQHDMNLLWFKRWATLGQINLTFFVASNRTVFWPNIVSFLWQVCIVYMDGTLRLHTGWHIWNAFSEATTVFTVGWFAEEWLWCEVTARADEMKASKAEEIAHGLLSLLCDAVVPLGSDLSLRQPCPKFTAMLIRDRRDGGLGEPFINFCSKPDRPRFLEFMAESSWTQGNRCLHVHLMDSMGTSVPVQLFHTSLLQDPEGTQYIHLLGITEDKETPSDVMPSAPAVHIQYVAEDGEHDDQNTKGGDGFRDTGEDDSEAKQSERSFKLSAARSEPGSSVFGWGRAAYCSFKAELTLELVEECDECAALFAFGQGEQSMVSRVQDPGFWIWLEHLHLKAIRGEQKPRRESVYGEVDITSAGGVNYKAIISAFVEALEAKDTRFLSQLYVQLEPPELPKTPTSHDILREARRESRTKRKKLKDRAFGPEHLEPEEAGALRVSEASSRLAV